MALTIELNGETIEIPGTDRDIIKAVGETIKQDGVKYTMEELRGRYKAYFASCLQGTCPVCEHELGSTARYCELCGAKVAKLADES